MEQKIKFRNLPFKPHKNQVFYFESQNDKKWNRFIRKNYIWLKYSFKEKGLEFCYLPILLEEAIEYFAPYSDNTFRDKRIKEVSSLAHYLTEGILDAPALLFGARLCSQDNSNEYAYEAIQIKKKWFTSKTKVFEVLADEICRTLKTIQDKDEVFPAGQDVRESKKDTPTTYSPDVRYSIDTSCVEERCEVKYAIREREEMPQDEQDIEVSRNDHIRFAIVTDNESCLWDDTQNGMSKEDTETCVADENLASEATMIIDEIKDKINALRGLGINTIFLHELIDQGEKLSRLHITKDKRLFLIDYNNREIKMTALVKAVFLLFLKHPAGIRFKELVDYYDELLSIYLDLNPNGSVEKQRNSIAQIIDPLGNSINEKCARIREAFISSFDERLAKNYFVTGERGEPKRITLDRNLVIWE